MSPTDKRSSGRKPKYSIDQEREVWDRKQRKRRRKLGQNFLKDERTAKRIVRESGITDTDLVVEFGAGSGMLTRPLAKRARRVVAVEYDSLWAGRLQRSFAAEENVEIVAANALSVPLPSEEPFRVVANVPFRMTTALLHRLLDDPTKPSQLLHLLVQKDVARKHVWASPTTLKTLNWSPWWRFETAFELSASAFTPKPEVDACLLVAAKRDLPLVDPGHRQLFRAFASQAFRGRGNVVSRTLRPVFTKRQIHGLARDNGFSADSLPSHLTVHQWASVFEFMVRAVPQDRWPIRERS